MDVVDVVALSVLAVGLLRGLWMGAVREAFSLAALACACLAVRYLSAPGAEWISGVSPVELGEWGARIVAGTVLAVGSLAAVGMAGRIVRRGVRIVGLGLADRFAGGLLGAAEGALMVALLMWLSIGFVGREHPVLAGTEALAVFEHAEEVAGGRIPLPSVAAPPRPDSR